MNSLSCIPYILQTLMWLVMRPILALFSNLRIIGKEHTEKIKDGAIVAVNHASDLDPVLIPATLGPWSPLMPVFSVALDRSFYRRPWPFNYLYSGFIFNLLGAYSMSSGARADYERILSPHIKLLERGSTLGIFPEGKRNFDGKITAGRPGVAYLAWRTRRPVIPVAIHGHTHMAPRDFFARKHSITVAYGAPITYTELFGARPDPNLPPTQDELKVATATIMSRIREMYERV